jgi:hypothetical protein
VDNVQVVELNEPEPDDDHVIVSPFIEPTYPETVAVQVVGEPATMVPGEQTGEVVVIAAARTASASSAQRPLLTGEQLVSEEDVQKLTLKPDWVAE